MRRFLLALATAIACSTASPASAEITGNVIYNLCNGKGESKLSCLMYVAGALEYFSFVDHTTDGYLNPFCPPADNTHVQTADIFTRYLREHPETRHDPAVVLLLLALSEAWPCL